MAVSAREVLAAIAAGDSWDEGFGPLSFMSDLIDDAANLPPIDAAGFEVPMRGEGTADFGIGLGASDRLGETLALWSFDEATLGNPISAWRRVHSFLSRWIVPQSSEKRHVTHLFLEFDTSVAKGLSEPSLFLGFDLGDARNHGSIAGMIGSLLAERMTPELSDALEASMRFLPSSSWILHGGVMFGRSGGVRMHAMIPSEATPGYVRSTSGREVAEQVEWLLDRYVSGDPVATLQVEVSPQGDSSGVGVEFSSSSPGPNRLRGWIAQLIGDGLCEPERGTAVLRWKRSYRSPLDVGGWPCRLRHEVSHLKVTVRPDQPLRAKAYLSVVPSFSLVGRA